MPKPMTLAQRMAEMSDALAKRIVGHANTMLDQVGDSPPFGAVPLKPEEQAIRQLPSWYVFGRAQSPEGEAYRADLIKHHGPREALNYDIAMQKLHEKYPLHAVLGMSPDLGRAYLDQRARGAYGGTNG